ncbi:MAG: DUF433 domain-containing protein [Actinobacteria bacterium]|nr:DUF433 domain-containing protein [Actinomycetota bacterium]
MESSFDDGVFTSQQVMRLSGITKRRLDYWIEKGIVTPDIDRARGRGRVRLFSFANLVEFRVAAWLRDKVSLQLIGKIVQRLRAEETLRPLARVTFAVIEDHVRGRPHHRVVVQQADGSWEEWHSGQKIMEITVPLRTFEEELRRLAQEDRRRSRRVGKTERRRGVLGSAEVIAGTRVPTSSIWSLHEAGYNVERILDSYPGLEREDVLGAVEAEERRRSSKARAG